MPNYLFNHQVSPWNVRHTGQSAFTGLTTLSVILGRLSPEWVGMLLVNLLFLTLSKITDILKMCLESH